MCSSPAPTVGRERNPRKQGLRKGAHGIPFGLPVPVLCGRLFEEPLSICQFPLTVTEGEAELPGFRCLIYESLRDDHQAFEAGFRIMGTAGSVEGKVETSELGIAI
ncbi:hypothetical protein KEU06_28350 [Pseudaminobacter sp. 19-2017]|uniref:Uncharacterized protein n=1 Tax=Pseudaminobacter soli (ex Zhang et al. 2022) TaxID=2831468 RepID=A0A942E2B0_9HYPH|nr:hypothetical protein [Pseudaminobacter soli]MBS3652499.1 hypothetical protein [Pseudaminobacter soli]